MYIIQLKRVVFFGVFSYKSNVNATTYISELETLNKLFNVFKFCDKNTEDNKTFSKLIEM